MTRWVLFGVCVLVGLVQLACGLLVPVHLRAVDVSVLQKAGCGTPSVVEQGLALVRENQLGGAQMLSSVANDQVLPGCEKLAYAVANLSKQHPGWDRWGCPEPRFESIFTSSPQPPLFTEYVVRLENRDRVLELLSGCESPGVKQLLYFRLSTNTVLFPPSQSSSGQALDAAISLSGLLMERGQLSASLSNALYGLAVQANHGGNSEPFEQALLDLLSLGQRFNWGQLALFVSRIEDPTALSRQAALVRNAGSRLPLLFSAVQLSGTAGAVAGYLSEFRQTGMDDLASTLRYGTGSVKELLQRKQRLHAASPLPSETFSLVMSFADFASNLAWRMPRMALAVKWLFYLLAGFFLAAAMHFARPAVSNLELPLQVRGFHIARETLFALGFLLVVLLLSEPFLAQESQKVESHLRVRLPMVGTAARAENTPIRPTLMNHSLLTLLLFFVLQGLIYTACVVKLAEIRRQKVPPRTKLKLLENEDHLFDAGLYLGFVGTVISLILVSLGIIKFSLMAAYSSTSFGIIFVSVFKIFHLRPARRKLLLEAESSAPEAAGSVGQPAFVTPS